MSFTSQVKNEIIQHTFQRCCLKQFLRGFIQENALVELRDQVFWCTLSSINAAVIRKLFTWIKALSFEPLTYEFFTTRQKGFLNNQNYHFSFLLQDQRLQNHLGIRAPIIERINYQLLNQKPDHCQRALIAGVFISQGNLSDPKKSGYHLSIAFNNLSNAEFFRKWLIKKDFKFKVVANAKHWDCYLKQASQISDFLKLIDAAQAMLEFENYRIYRDISVNVNRLNNVEIHNQQLTNQAADEQLRIIKFLKDQDLLVQLPLDHQKLLKIRQIHPEASFAELANYYSEQYRLITRSTVNHWFRAIKQFYLKHHS